MARQSLKRDTSPILAAAEQWINTCLVQDGSLFSQEPRWTGPLITDVYDAFVGHPDTGHDDFITKLKGQMRRASPAARQLMAEMLWGLLLFPSNMKAGTKSQQIRDIWTLSGQRFPESLALMEDKVLVGIGSGGPGFNNYRPDELEYLIALLRDLKQKRESERRSILTDYDEFFRWIDAVPRKGSRQFRHMLRFFAFPDLVERISSNNDRRKILKAFAVGTAREVDDWSDRELDEKMLELRNQLQRDRPSAIIDFYEPPLRQRWAPDRTVKTPEGEVSVTVPSDEDELDDKEPQVVESKSAETRESLKVQAKLAEIGAVMGFNIWLPSADRGRIREFLPVKHHPALLETLPLNYDDATLDTIKQIDVLWLKRRSIVRAFEVEHTTAVYSGLLRMADLLALQPNMDIRIHIVAQDERREKVFREMNRPVFSLLDRGPLSRRCSFISYESVNAINDLEHLAHTNESIIDEYEERSESLD